MNVTQVLVFYLFKANHFVDIICRAGSERHNRRTSMSARDTGHWSGRECGWFGPGCQLAVWWTNHPGRKSLYSGTNNCWSSLKMNHTVVYACFGNILDLTYHIICRFTGHNSCTGFPSHSLRREWRGWREQLCGWTRSSGGNTWGNSCWSRNQNFCYRTWYRWYSFSIYSMRTELLL